MLLDFATPRPLADAIASLSAKTPIGSLLRSADWARVPLELRESAFFSSAVEEVRLLQSMEDGLLGLVKLQRRRLAAGGEGAYLSRSRFIQEAHDLAVRLGVDTRRDDGDTGTLADIRSVGRLGLIFDIQTQRAAEYAKWKVEQDADLLATYPCQELIRLEDRKVPREWSVRWQDAGGRFFGPGGLDGALRMIARKDDPIWIRISRFGTPWPPFDFQSGVGLDDIGRTEAVKLGVIAKGERAEPQAKPFTEAMQASVRGLSPRYQGALKTIFGDQVEIADGVAKWKGGTQ